MTGLLKGNGTGALQSAVSGMDYQAPLTFSYPFINSANSISLGFGTTTANIWSGLQTFAGGLTTTNATTTNLFATSANFGNLSASNVSVQSANKRNTAISILLFKHAWMMQGSAGEYLFRAVTII